MQDTLINRCACENCAGASCTCGCQQAATTQVCGCGSQCQCGERCACGDRENL
jgi:hypothetical protein